MFCNNRYNYFVRFIISHFDNIFKPYVCLPNFANSKSIRNIFLDDVWLYHFCSVNIKLVIVNKNAITEIINEKILSFIADAPFYVCAAQTPEDKPLIKFKTFCISRLRSFFFMAFCCLFRCFEPFAGGSFLVNICTGLYIL